MFRAALGVIRFSGPKPRLSGGLSNSAAFYIDEQPARRARQSRDWSKVTKLAVGAVHSSSMRLADKDTLRIPLSRNFHDIIGTALLKLNNTTQLDIYTESLLDHDPEGVSGATSDTVKLLKSLLRADKVRLSCITVISTEAIGRSFCWRAIGRFFDWPKNETEKLITQLIAKHRSTLVKLNVSFSPDAVGEMDCQFGRRRLTLTLSLFNMQSQAWKIDRTFRKIFAHGWPITDLTLRIAEFGAPPSCYFDEATGKAVVITTEGEEDIDDKEADSKLSSQELNRQSLASIIKRDGALELVKIIRSLQNYRTEDSKALQTLTLEVNYRALWTIPVCRHILHLLPRSLQPNLSEYSLILTLKDVVCKDENVATEKLITTVHEVIDNFGDCKIPVKVILTAQLLIAQGDLDHFKNNLRSKASDLLGTMEPQTEQDKETIVQIRKGNLSVCLKLTTVSARSQR